MNSPAPDAPRGDPETGAVQALPESALAGRHVDSAVELLEGRVPGLLIIRQPNGDVALQIRGAPNSLRDGGEPLLVIDGMPAASGNVTGALRGLKPHQIASIEVLKDVSSTSVYGMRGANGVILIRTKRD
jgi:TonB-dependent SusC/RagA subfamily outer membrane receptor